MKNIIYSLYTRTIINEFIIIKNITELHFLHSFYDMHFRLLRTIIYIRFLTIEIFEISYM